MEQTRPESLPQFWAAIRTEISQNWAIVWVNVISHSYGHRRGIGLESLSPATLGLLS